MGRKRYTGPVVTGLLFFKVLLEQLSCLNPNPGGRVKTISPICQMRKLRLTGVQ